MKTQNIISASSDVITMARCKKNMAISVSSMLLGVVLLIAAGQVFVGKESTGYLFCMTLGVILVAFFGMKLFVGAKKPVYTPTNSDIKEHALFFNSEQMHKLEKAIEKGDFSCLYEISDKMNPGVRLDVVISSDHQFAAYQIFKYIPHNYEPVSEIHRINDECKDNFCKIVKDLKGKQS